MNELYDILERLVFLKDYKDKHGKDKIYAYQKRRVWNRAREVLNDNRPK